MFRFERGDRVAVKRRTGGGDGDDGKLMLGCIQEHKAEIIESAHLRRGRKSVRRGRRTEKEIWPELFSERLVG